MDQESQHGFPVSPEFRQSLAPYVIQHCRNLLELIPELSQRLPGDAAFLTLKLAVMYGDDREKMMKIRNHYSACAVLVQEDWRHLRTHTNISGVFNDFASLNTVQIPQDVIAWLTLVISKISLNEFHFPIGVFYKHTCLQPLRDRVDALMSEIANFTLSQPGSIDSLVRRNTELQMVNQQIHQCVEVENNMENTAFRTRFGSFSLYALDQLRENHLWRPSIGLLPSHLQPEFENTFPLIMDYFEQLNFENMVRQCRELEEHIANSFYPILEQNLLDYIGQHPVNEA